MNYQYQDDGTKKTYTVNGTVYHSIEDVPAEHRSYFINIDKNNNGVPDKLEPLMNALDGNAGVGKVLGALFTTVKSEMTKDIGFEEVSAPVAKQKPARYNKGAVQKGEGSLGTTIFIAVVVAAILLAVAWYFGLIGF